MPRPTKLTPEIQQCIADAIRAGNYAKVAAECAGVGETTFYRWMQMGERARSGRFREFWESIRIAEAEAEVRAVKAWQAAIPENWKAAMHWLARRYPDRWGPTQRHEGSGPRQGPIEVEVVWSRHDAHP
jgi:hypothetical protein